MPEQCMCFSSASPAGEPLTEGRVMGTVTNHHTIRQPKSGMSGWLEILLRKDDVRPCQGNTINVEGHMRL